MHPSAEVSLRTFSGPEHGGAKSGEDGQSPLAPTQGFVLPRRTEHTFVALLRGLEGGTSDGSFHQPGLLH
eukprot:2581837-Amphidinium_carterae.1